MTTLEMVEAIKGILATRLWGGSGSLVFGSVHISPGPSQQAAALFRYPLALINIGTATINPQRASLASQEVGVVIVATQTGDTIGELAMIGGNKSGGVTESKGRGLLEIQEEVLAAIRELNGAENINIQWKSSSIAPGELIEGTGFTVLREYMFIADVESGV